MFYGKVKLITRLIGGKRNEAYIIRRNYEFNDSSLVEGVLHTVSRLSYLSIRSHQSSIVIGLHFFNDFNVKKLKIYHT